jgi:hypothetical protein
VRILVYPLGLEFVLPPDAPALIEIRSHQLWGADSEAGPWRLLCKARTRGDKNQG